MPDERPAATDTELAGALEQADRQLVTQHVVLARDILQSMLRQSDISTNDNGETVTRCQVVTELSWQ